ncbi:MAG: hypothetical protein WC907_01810 [Acholeplasmataceae bacterium]
MNNLLRFDLLKTPFSIKGAFLSIFKRPNNLGGGIWIKSLIRTSWGDINKIKPSILLLKIIPTDINGIFTEYNIYGTPTHIKIEIPNGDILIYFNQYNQLTFIFNNSGIVFEYENFETIDVKDNNKVIKVDYKHTNQYIDIKPNTSNLYYEKDLNRLFYYGNIKDSLTLSFWVNELEHPKYYSYYHNIDDILKEYNNFKKHYNVKTEYDELAIYTLWILSYVACGNFTYEAIAISKNDMNLTWGWDHLMIGLSIVKSNPKLVKDSIKVFFDHQKDNGMLVDAINPLIIVDKYTKPPVYGYFLKKMIENGLILTKKEKEYFYEKLSKSTNWWMSKNNKYPVYLHPFDSGWDNATCFDSGEKFITPDLISYIIHQMHFLEILAKDLNKEDEFIEWKNKRNTLLKNFINDFYNKGEFLFESSIGKQSTTSLIKLIPIILYKWLPKEIIKKLINDLKIENHFLTSKGLATESLKSIQYDTRIGDKTKPNAYWRGPIWAPPLYMIVDSLKGLNENELANLITKRYLKTLESSNAFYENYDAITGDGYDDISYGWTAAIYILLKGL